MQCFSLIPGVSRSGATISAGLMRGIDRVTATELSFFMAIPALTAAGLFQAARGKDDLVDLGVGPMLVGIVVAFGTAYASIAWLLRFVAHQLAASVHLVPHRPRPARHRGSRRGVDHRHLTGRRPLQPAAALERA